MRKTISFLLAGTLLVTLTTATADPAAPIRFELAEFFEFHVPGDWGKAKIDEKKSAAVLYRQGTAESKDGSKALVFATMQILDPAKVKNPALQKVDANGMANFMFKSMMFTGEEADAVKPETEIVDLKDAGPAEKYFRFAEPGGAGKVFLSGISLSGKKGAYAILVVEKKTGVLPPRDKAFWRKVAKSVKTK